MAMGKISPVSIKYIVTADVTLTGMVEKPDVIGAIFGQTEGLLGSELELRELQKSGRIGRIEVNLESKGGKTVGFITIPSSMDKSETAIVAASLETIERVGPCESTIRVKKIEDIRISKRNFILDRAKELLKNLIEDMPDSAAITDDVTRTVRALEITTYGKDKLPAGPGIDDTDEVLIVEGRADVVNLLKYGFRNVIALNGAKACDTVVNLIQQKVATLFVDGDRGGDLIIKNLSSMADLDFIAKAPDGKEVEELTLKEINKVLRAKVPFELADEAKNNNNHSAPEPREHRYEDKKNDKRGDRRDRNNKDRRPQRNAPLEELAKKDSTLLKGMADDLIGSHGAFVLDRAFNILGKVPVKELEETIKDLSEEVYAVVLDAAADPDLIRIAEKKKISFVVAKDIKGASRVVTLLTPDKL